MSLREKYIGKNIQPAALKVVGQYGWCVSLEFNAGETRLEKATYPGPMATPWGKRIASKQRHERAI